MGITFLTDGMDANNWLNNKLNDWFAVKNYSNVDDWLGSDWQSGLSTSGVFLALRLSLWLAVKEFVDWLRSSGSVPSDGSVSNPVTMSLVSPVYLDISIDSVLYSNFPCYNLSSLSFNSGVVYAGMKSYQTPSLFTSPFVLPLSYYSGSGSSHTFSFVHNNISIPYYYTFQSSSAYDCGFLSGKSNFDTPYITSVLPVRYPNALQYSIDTRYPVYLVFVYSEDTTRVCPAFSYMTVSGYPNIVFTNTNYYYFTPFVSSGGLSVSSSGVPSYPFNSVDPVYINLQIGELQSSLDALNSFLVALNQNLVDYTIALQLSSPADLPVDTSSFNDLVSNYESITQDVITGQVSLSSGLSSMYTLLSASLSQISNSSLANACINAYNAFLNKLSLFQSSGGSSTSYTYTTVQTLQSTLDTYYQSFSVGSITYDQMLSTAAGALSTSVSSATSTQEILSLNNVYRSFLQRVGATLDSSTYSQDVIDGFNDTLDDYTDGTLSRSQALSSLKSDYRSGIAGTSSAVDVAAITAAYQSAVDQIATSEFTLSTSAGQISAEAIELEDSIIDDFDYASLSAMLDFQNWQFFPDQEANLYREYFQRFFSESDSPFYAFLYYPLVLGVAGLILGTGIRFAVRARKSRGSSNVQGGDT